MGVYFKHYFKSLFNPLFKKWTTFPCHCERPKGVQQSPCFQIMIGLLQSFHSFAMTLQHSLLAKRSQRGFITTAKKSLRSLPFGPELPSGLSLDSTELIVEVRVEDLAEGRPLR